MKRVLLGLALIIMPVVKTAAQPTPPLGQRWVCVEELTDEFDTWDDSKWEKSLWNYGVPVQMREENSGVESGNLWIKATLDEGAERWFKTSRVTSKMRISYPMYTECRMRTSDLSAFSTFWMNNGNSHERDEIDMCESNSNPSRKEQVDRPYTLYSQYFVVHDGDTERDNGNFDNRRLSTENPAYGKCWNEEYQVIGVWWKDANNIQFYINGEEAGAVQSTRNFTRELNIIWDLWTDDEEWTGGIANPEDLANDDINTMYVDWIHTFRLCEDESK
ncbi:MAG: hypothetical protein SNH18_06485 [Rikenellaceae bacterium]